jgi:hypothetical protein
VLYHMANINLHANIGLLQRHARSIAKVDHALLNSQVFTSVQKWLSSRHYDVAVWHAERLLRITISIMGIDHWALSDPRSSEGPPNARTFASQPPHLPFCVYFASLVLWYGRLDSGQGRLRRNSHIDAGIRLLFHLEVQVAKYLGNALFELTQEGPEPQGYNNIP